MHDQELKTEEAALFAYPARLIFMRSGGELELSAVISDISHAGATLQVDARRLQLPEPSEQPRLRLEFTGPAGRTTPLAARLQEVRGRAEGQATLRLSFENIHLAEVEEIQALKASPRKDHRLLWGLWDSLQEAGA
jgi:hypothetical protein